MFLVNSSHLNSILPFKEVTLKVVSKVTADNILDSLFS